MKIAVLGTGGVGGYFGGKLAQKSHEVYFLARNQHLDAIKKNGLIVKSVDGDFTIHSAHVSDSIADFPKVDLVLVTSKAEHVEMLAPQIPSLLHDNSVVIPLQNGLASEDILQQNIPFQQIIPALCKIFSKVEAPGIIHHFNWNQPIIQIGESDKTMSERVKFWVKIFNEAGFSAHAESDIWLEKWKKFMFICSGGLLAVTRSTYGEIREFQPGRKMLKELFTEIYHVGKAKQINWTEDVIDHAMQTVDNSGYKATASIQRDIDAKKPSELEFLNGTVVKYAHEMDMYVPINEFVYRALSVTEHYARKNR